MSDHEPSSPAAEAPVEAVQAPGVAASEAPLAAEAHAEAPAGAHPETAKAGGKKKVKKKVPFGTRLANVAKDAAVGLVEMFRSLASPDRPTRRMSALFVLSLAATLSVGVLTVRRVLLPPKPSVHASAEGGHGAEPSATHGDASAHGGHGAKPAEPQLTMLDLGTFSVELKPAAGKRGPARSANLADVTLVLECDTPETYTYIEQRLAQARNEITGVILLMEREELLSREGKQRLKNRIIDQINSWLPKGKVQNVFISKLMVG